MSQGVPEPGGVVHQEAGQLALLLDLLQVAGPRPLAAPPGGPLGRGLGHEGHPPRPPAPSKVNPGLAATPCHRAQTFS